MFKDSNEQIKSITKDKNIELSRIKSQKQIKGKDLLELFESLNAGLVSHLSSSEDAINAIDEKIKNLEKQANINPLTKMQNHKKLSKDLKYILNFGKQRDLNTFLVVLDADDFKEINQAYGHVAGDKTLIYISNILKASLRQGTQIYHTKDNEFAIILNRLTKNEAVSIISRILREIASSKLFYKGHNINLTLSAGISKHKEQDEVETFIQRSVGALKEAKNDGKNCFKEAL